MINDEPITLLTPTIAYDENKDEIETWTETELRVLFATPTTTQIDENMRLYGVRVGFIVHFPKTFTASVRGCKIFRPRDGRTYDVAGDPQPYPPENCPSHVPWNREVGVGWIDG